jgi:hypothetical protein
MVKKNYGGRGKPEWNEEQVKSWTACCCWKEKGKKNLFVSAAAFRGFCLFGRLRWGFGRFLGGFLRGFAAENHGEMPTYNFGRTQKKSRLMPPPYRYFLSEMGKQSIVVRWHFGGKLIVVSGRGTKKMNERGSKFIYGFYATPRHKTNRNLGTNNCLTFSHRLRRTGKRETTLKR